MKAELSMSVDGDATPIILVTAETKLEQQSLARFVAMEGSIQIAYWEGSGHSGGFVPSTNQVADGVTNLVLQRGP